jgi:single-stranded-DNA-specific exonuclease
LRDLLPDPRSLKDMEKAAARFLTAVEQRQRIAVFADYDVDGGSSAALLLIWLRDMGCKATLYVPDRIDEGYGPNDEAMAALAAQHDLIICVDCGTLSHGPIAAAKGADVIVLDHHLGGETLPDALAIVNPNRQDEDGACAHLCAAAVVFLMLVEAGRQLRDAARKGPDLMAMLDLVALATVADVAPLIGVNRAFVRQGLRVMARRERPGLTALADVARMETAPTAYHLGYLLGPRINAGGRIGQADLGARLLASNDPHETAALAERLDTLNTERREVEAAVRAAALDQAEERGFDAPLVWAVGPGWHPGVVGIVASRLKEASNRPSIVIGVEDGIGKGSGRSVSGIDMGAPIQRLAAEGLLIKGGGHKMAAGLTVAEDKIEPAMARLGELLAKQGAHLGGPADLNVTGLLMPGAATVELAEMVEQAGPFGASAPAPRYVFADMQILFAKRVGESHLKISFGDGLGGKMDAIAFGAFDGPMGPALEAHGGARFHLAGKLDINTWRGRQSVQLRLEDAAPA